MTARIEIAINKGGHAQGIDLFIEAILIVAFWFAALGWATRFAILSMADHMPFRR